MALKKTWSTPITTGDTRLADGADRKRMAQELHDALIDIGLTQTADTGQMANFDAMETELPNTAAFHSIGYRIYAFNDSLSASKPIFLKVTYGGWSNPSTSIWRSISFIFEVGTGTDGAGAITGGVAYPATLARPATAASASYFCNTGSMPSMAYAGEGIFWVAFKCGALKGFSGASTAGINRPVMGEPYPMFTLVVARTCDAAGAPSGDGLVSMLPIFTTTILPSPINSSEIYQDTRVISFGSGAVRVTRSPVARPCMDVLASAGGNLLASKPYAPVDSGLVGVYGVSAVSGVAVNTGDLVNASVHGLADKSYLVPHRGVIGLNHLIGVSAGVHGIVGSPSIDTLLLLWED